MNLVELRESIRRHESYRRDPYRDSLDKWTCATGHLIHDMEIPRGLHTMGALLDWLTDNQRHVDWFNADVERASADARAWLGDTLDELTDVQQNVVVEMAFQLGLTRLSGFKQMRAALDAHNVGLAADEGMRSLWAHQTPDRARELMDRLRG